METLTVVNRTAPAIINQQSLIDNWISFLDVADRTAETYSRNIRAYGLYLKEQGIDIAQTTREDVLAYKRHLMETKKPTTVQAYIMAVKQLYKWAEVNNLYPDIAKNIKGVKLDTGFKKDYLTTTQVGKLLAVPDRSTLKGKRDYAVMLLIITTGLRTVEIERANVEDMRSAGDNMALFVQGKGHTEKNDYVKLAEPVEDAIRDYLAARGKTEPQEPLFYSIAHRNAGERMTTRSISRLVKENLIAAGLESDRLTAHSLRHTAATLNLLNGGTVEETQQLLRHTNINTTMIYVHSLERAKNNSEDRIAAAIFA